MSEMSEQWRSKMGWENVGNVRAMVEQDGDGKMSEMLEQSRSRWTGKMSEQSWSKVGKKMVYDTKSIMSMEPRTNKEQSLNMWN